MMSPNGSTLRTQFIQPSAGGLAFVGAPASTVIASSPHAASAPRLRSAIASLVISEPTSVATIRPPAKIRTRLQIAAIEQPAAKTDADHRNRDVVGDGKRADRPRAGPIGGNQHDAAIDRRP